MGSFIYHGDDRVYPSLGLTVSDGDAHDFGDDPPPADGRWAATTDNQQPPPPPPADPATSGTTVPDVDPPTAEPPTTDLEKD